MSCPVNLPALPAAVYDEVVTPETVRGRPGGASILSFPRSRAALWDGTPSGETLSLQPCCRRKPRLVLQDKALRLAQRHARHSNKPCLHVFFLGSVSVEEDEEGISLTLDRFDPGRNQTGASSRVPSALLPGDIPVPCVFSCQTEATSDVVVQSESDLHLCFKAMQQDVCGRQPLELSQLFKVKGHISCCQQKDAAAFTLIWSTVCPAVALDVHPVRPVPIIPTALLRSLTSIARTAHATGRQRGFLTMDQTRKLLLMLESDPKACSLPLVGVWLSGVRHIYNPRVWAWCLRFLFGSALQDRVFSESGWFLLVVFASTHRTPQFFQCRPGARPLQLDWQLLSASQCVTLYQAAPTAGPPLQCQLTSERQARQSGVFRDAVRSFSRSNPLRVGVSISDQDSGVEDDELSPRPSPSPHLPLQQVRRVQPSVPELSLLIDGSFGCTNQIALSEPGSANQPSADRKDDTLPSSAPPPLHSTPNSNLQPPCDCQGQHCTLFHHTPSAIGPAHNHTPSTIGPAPNHTSSTIGPAHNHTPTTTGPAHNHTPSLRGPAHNHSPSSSSSYHNHTPSPLGPAHNRTPPPLSSSFNHTPSALGSSHNRSPPSSGSSHNHTPSARVSSSNHALLAPSPSNCSPPSLGPSHNHAPLVTGSSHNHAPIALCPSNCSPPSFGSSHNHAPLALGPSNGSPPSLASSHNHAPSPIGSSHTAAPQASPTCPFPSLPPASCSCCHAPVCVDPPPAAPVSWPCCVNPPDTYHLLLQQDRQLRLLQAQVQMLLEAQGKLQAAGRHADTQTQRATTSVAVETGASLFWGEPVQLSPRQDAPETTPSSPGSPPSPSARDLSVTRPVGGAEVDDITEEEEASSSPCRQPEGSGPPDAILEGSPVLGESASMGTPAEQGQSFYHNLMNQLNSRLQESEDEQEAAAPRRRSLPAVPDQPCGKKRAGRGKEPVLDATLRRLQELGVDVRESELTASNRRVQETVENSSTLACISPAALVSRLSASESSATSLPGVAVDLSLEANAIALRYLSDRHLSRLSLGGHVSPLSPASSMGSLLSPSNMSLATRKYMRRYGLIEEEEEEDDEEEEDVPEASARRPLVETLNLKSPPQSRLIRELRPKLQQLVGGSEPHRRKENCPVGPPSVGRPGGGAVAEGSLGNILDLSRLRQLPKLF